jgi:iron complex transport system substrate-binding protein
MNRKNNYFVLFRLRQGSGATALACAVAVVSFVVFVTAVPSARVAGQAKAPQRIISVIPAVTEMLFAIGAGPQVVAVGSFDRYPPQVDRLPRVGALLDPDLERILSLKPDLVAVYGSQEDLRKQLDRAGVPTYVYRHAGLADVTTTIRQLGERVGHREESASLAARIEAQIEAVRKRVAGAARPRTLIVFGREAGALRGIYASGGVGFIHDMVAAAGGDNVFADVKREAVQATAELILARHPDVVLELRISEISGDRLQAEINVWGALSALPAVRNHRVYILSDARTVVPGPRVAEGIELIARVLHP